MPKISAELEQQLKQFPQRTFDLLLRTTSEATPHLKWLDSAGLRVKQQFRLSPGVAVVGTGQAALKLLNQDWIVSIELDVPVQIA
jgi:hypothetical protein